MKISEKKEELLIRCSELQTRGEADDGRVHRNQEDGKRKRPKVLTGLTTERGSESKKESQQSMKIKTSSRLRIRKKETSTRPVGELEPGD